MGFLTAHPPIADHVPGVDLEAQAALARFIANTLETTIRNRRYHDAWQTWFQNLAIYEAEALELIKDRGDPDENDLGED